jgi:hypothetical protein
MIPTLTALLASLDGVDPHQFILSALRINRRISQYWEVPVLHYVENQSAAETLIPTGWTHTISQLVPGKYMVTLSDGQTIVSTKMANNALGFNHLPVAICQAVIFATAKPHVWGMIGR